jgi:hypothetical protein
VVVDKSDVFWTEPRDLPVEKAKKGGDLRFYKNHASYLTSYGTRKDYEKGVAGETNGSLSEPPVFELEPNEK